MTCVKWKKGQVSVEFVTVIGILLVVFMMAGYVVYTRYARTSDLKVYIDGLMVVTPLADTINTVNTVGDGYSLFYEIPAKLYAFSDYNISFYPRESAVFIHGSSFAKSRTLFFSSPISAIGVECYMKYCDGVCNTTVDETCIRVNETIKTRIKRHNGKIIFTEEYNIYQSGIDGGVIPFITRGDGYLASTSIASGELILGNSVMFINENTEKKRVELIFKHNVSDTLTLDIKNMMGRLDQVVSDDEIPMEFSLITEPEGSWDSTPGDLDGAMIAFNSPGFRICIKPVQIPASSSWVWLNADGSNIILDKQNDICISYP